jgi:hypothetical protein
MTIESYGKDLLDRFNLTIYRTKFRFNFTITDDSCNDIIIDFIKSKLNIDCTNYEIIHKQIDMPGLKFHIDDCVIVTKKVKPIYNSERFIELTENKYLYFHNKFNKLPKKTIIFYLSTFNIDFTGGILKFIDGVEIKPIAQTGIIFDSRDAHMVTPVKSGIRKICLVKIY